MEYENLEKLKRKQEFVQAQRTLTKAVKKVFEWNSYPWSDMPIERVNSIYNIEDAEEFFKDELDMFILNGVKCLRIYDGHYYDHELEIKSKSFDLSLKVKEALASPKFCKKISTRLKKLYETGQICSCVYRSGDEIKNIINDNLSGLVHWIRILQHNNCYSNLCLLDEIESIIENTHKC